MSRLYLDTGLLAWNGNESIGNEKIQKYFQELPTSEHVINTLDAQPIIDDSVGGQPTYLIQVSGTVKFQANNSKPFQQTFMITAAADKWKIASDCFRMQDALSLEKKWDEKYVFYDPIDFVIICSGLYKKKRLKSVLNKLTQKMNQRLR